MKRTNSVESFFLKNRRLLLLLMLPLLGCLGGVLLYTPMREKLPADFATLLSLNVIDGGAYGVFAEWMTACFQPLCLLLLLFISGISACGAPIVLLIPLFWGVGAGFREAYYAQAGGSGWLVLAVLFLPAAVMELVALLMACSEALRMTTLLTVQLLPRAARCGGLWQDFRLYGLRFLLLLVLTLGAAALDVILRLLFGRLLL